MEIIRKWHYSLPCQFTNGYLGSKLSITVKMKVNVISKNYVGKSCLIAIKLLLISCFLSSGQVTITQVLCLNKTYRNVIFGEYIIRSTATLSFRFIGRSNSRHGTF